MMVQHGEFKYADIADPPFQVLELPCEGNLLSLVILLPKNVDDGVSSLRKVFCFVLRVSELVSGRVPQKSTCFVCCGFHVHFLTSCLRKGPQGLAGLGKTSHSTIQPHAGIGRPSNLTHIQHWVGSACGTAQDKGNQFSQALQAAAATNKQTQSCLYNFSHSSLQVRFAIRSWKSWQQTCLHSE